MPCFLKGSKSVGKTLYISWKFIHDQIIPALVLGKPMLDSSIGLCPGRLASVRRGPTDETISTIPAESVEHRIVSSTQCPFEI